jgi:hypothetical protein
VHEETATMRAYPTNYKLTTMAVLASVLILALVASSEAVVWKWPWEVILDEKDHDPCRRVYHCRNGVPPSIEIECKACCSKNGNRYHNVAMVANYHYECTCWEPKRIDRGDDSEDEWDNGPVIPYDVDDYPSDMRASPYDEEHPCYDVDYSRPRSESEKQCRECCLRHKASSSRTVENFGYECQCVWDERKGRRSRGRSTRRQVANYD